MKTWGEHELAFEHVISNKTTVFSTIKISLTFDHDIYVVITYHFDRQNSHFFLHYICRDCVSEKLLIYNFIIYISNLFCFVLWIFVNLKAWRRYDTDRSGYIEANELRVS